MLNISVSFFNIGYCPSSFKHLSHLSTSFWMPDAKNDVVPYQQSFLCREQTSYTKRVLLDS